MESQHNTIFILFHADIKGFFVYEFFLFFKQKYI